MEANSRTVTLLSKPLGPCFGCGELEHLPHQCLKADTSLSVSTGPRVYPFSGLSLTCADSGVVPVLQRSDFEGIAVRT